MSRLRSMSDERGVAMITVLLVAAALTTVAAASSFMAIQQLKASTADWRGTRAVSYGEAGLQRFLNELKLGSYSIGSIIGAGCTMPPVTLPQGVVGDGTYDAQLTVYNPNTTPQIPVWTGTTNTTGACAGRDFTTTKIPQLYAISSTGTAVTGKRTIRSVVSISGSGLPVGVFVNTIDANGNPDFTNISIFAKGDIVGRDKINVGGIDPNFTIGDVYGTANSLTATQRAQQAPAAVHTIGAIYGKQAGGKRKPIHPPNPNCSVGRGPQGQGMWDSSGTGGTVSAACTPAWTFPVGWTGPPYPPTTRFTVEDYDRVGGGRPNLPQLNDAEYQSLKATAQASGLYCNIPASGPTTCTRNGLTWTGSMTDITSSPLLPSHFVAYYDFAPGANGNLNWNNSVQPCPTKSATVVVRNGDVTLRGGGVMYGTIVAPEGAVDAAGNYVVYGSIIANTMRLRGTAGFALDTCAANNAPATTLNVSPGRWSEVDR